MSKEMMKIWFDPKEPIGYTGVAKLAKKVKASQKETSKWLTNQLAYSLNKPMRKRFPTRKYITNGPNDLWQADLMEMIPYSSINDGYKYILNCIDVFSRYVQAIPIKSKNKSDVAEAMEKIFEEKQPLNFQTDLGKEFYNNEVKKILDKYNVNHYSVHSQYKAALVERFNRTLRDRLKKYCTKQGNKKWVDVLPKIIFAYNHSEHKGLNGLRPVDALDGEISRKLWLQNKNKNKKLLKKPKYKIGDFVRISKISASPFVKNFDQNWSDEVFQIIEINIKQNPVMYTIADEKGDKIDGKFYEMELQVLPEKPSVYRIQEVLQEKGRGKNKQILVKWHGYDEPSWIKYTDLV